MGGNLGQGNNRGIIQLFCQDGQTVDCRECLQIGENFQYPVALHVKILTFVVKY
jgi:hypothetical protein